MRRKEANNLHKYILIPTINDRAINLTWRTIFEGGFLINFIPLPRVFTLSLYSIIDKTNYLQMIFPKCILMPTTDDRAFNFTWHTIFEGGILIDFVSLPRVFTLSLYSIIDKTNSLQMISGSGTGWWNLGVPILQLNSINLTQKGGTRSVVRVMAGRQHSLSQK